MLSPLAQMMPARVTLRNSFSCAEARGMERNKVGYACGSVNHRLTLHHLYGPFQMFARTMFGDKLTV